MTLNPLFASIGVVIKGAGDLAGGVAARLFRAGFPVVMTEHPTPTMVRRAVCFGAAVYAGRITIEGITAVKSSPAELEAHLRQGVIPVLVDPRADILRRRPPTVLVDAIMAKKNTGTRLVDAPLVIALGPGFTASVDCHVVIETRRGHWLGRAIVAGSAQADTGSPGSVRGMTTGRVLRAPQAGKLAPLARIGDRVTAGQTLALVGDTPVPAPFDGVLRGLIHPAVPLTPGFKIGDVDPRGNREHCFTISEKSLAIGGGVLEAMLAADVVRQKLTDEFVNRAAT